MPRFVLAAAAGLLLAAPAATQDPGRKATLRWFGQSFFQLETSTGKLVVFDPHFIPFFGRPQVKADVTLISHLHTDHNNPDALVEKGQVFRGVELKKEGPPDWAAVDQQIGQIRIRNLGTYHDALNGMQRGKNSVWVVEADGLTFVHLGDLGHELTPDQVKQIGKVDVLMVPVGGVYTLNGEQAQKVVKQLKPRLFVLPMHYGVPMYDQLLGPDEFLLGFKKDHVLRTPATNELAIPVEAKTPDAPTVVLLGWKKAEPPKKK
jgi:L-ascorbate metabolism protein UlaG (beta-lactamase superfamily)